MTNTVPEAQGRVSGKKRPAGHRLIAFNSWAFLAVFAAMQSSASAAETCKFKLIDSVPLTISKGHYFVHSRINGSDVDLLVDTGSQKTLVTAALVDKLNLPPDRRHWSRVAGAGGAGNPNYDVIISELLIGKLKLSDIRAAIDGEDLSTPDFQGILGADVILRGDVQIDFPNRLISFFEPSSCSGKPVAWQSPYLSDPATVSDRSGRLLFSLSLDGHPVRAVFDTGAALTVVARSAALAAGGGAKASPPRTLIDVNGRRSALQRINFAAVQIGTEGFHNVPVNVADLDFGEADALVGLDYLQKRVVWLSPARGRIFVLQPSHAVPVLRTSMTGDAPAKN